MVQPRRAAKQDTGASVSNLKFHRHPYADEYYAAYDEERVRVRHGDDWGDFSRDGVWIDGPLRQCDPIFARWVTSEHIFSRVIAASEKKK